MMLHIIKKMPLHLWTTIVKVRFHMITHIFKIGQSDYANTQSRQQPKNVNENI